MNFTLLSLLVIGFALAGFLVQGAPPAPEEPYADLWIKGTHAEKRLYVSGIATGLSLMRNALNSGVQNTNNSMGDSACGALCVQYTDTLYRWFGVFENGFTIDNTVMIMDRLYRKEKNKNFSFQQMYMVAINELRRLKAEGAGDSVLNIR